MVKFRNKSAGFIQTVRTLSPNDSEAIQKWLDENPKYELAEDLPKQSKSASFIASQGQGNWTQKARQKHGGWNEVLDKVTEAHPYAKFDK